MTSQHQDEHLELLHDGRHYLGEGVVWCERTGRVFWTDIGNSRLHALAPATGVLQEWVMPERLACFALTGDDDVLLLGLESRLAFFNLRSREFTPVCDVEADLPSTRLNDGRCDREGRFVFGTLDEHESRQAIAGFYRLNHDLTLERLPLPNVAISNSICFSVDGSKMYFTDSMHKLIYRWDGYASGDPSKVIVFTDLGSGPAAADGATIDADDHLWSAQWGGSRVVRYAPDGTVERMLHLPVSQPSCVAVGGPAFNDVFVTTAQEGLSEANLADEPLAGGLFHARLQGVRGMPEGRFGPVAS
jgi:L-arabinonolactonase